MRFIFIFIFSFSLITTFSQKKDTLNIITWNIYMRPRQVFHNNQIERAKEIVKAVLLDTIDIIVFQEIFDRKARNIIKDGLSLKYKFSVGPGKSGFFKLNSGVMIFSKFPINENNILYFNTCENSDCFAKKAVLYASIKINSEKKINLFGTHLQAIKGNLYNKIRSKQIDVIDLLVNTLNRKKTPSVFTGDFNISASDSLFQKLIKVFNVEQMKLVSERKYSADFDNDFRIGQAEKEGELIDHIFLNKNGSDAALVKSEILRKTYLKNKLNKDLSDHYIVRTKLIL